MVLRYGRGVKFQVESPISPPQSPPKICRRGGCVMENCRLIWSAAVEVRVEYLRLSLRSVWSVRGMNSPHSLHPSHSPIPPYRLHFSPTFDVGFVGGEVVPGHIFDEAGHAHSALAKQTHDTVEAVAGLSADENGFAVFDSRSLHEAPTVLIKVTPSLFHCAAGVRGVHILRWRLGRRGNLTRFCRRSVRTRFIQLVPRIWVINFCPYTFVFAPIRRH